MQSLKQNDTATLTNGRAAVAAWAVLLALALEKLSPDLSAIMAEETDFSWLEALGVPAEAGAATIRRAWTGLARLYHSDKGGRPEQMVRVNAAYEQAHQAAPEGNPHRR